MKLRILLGWLLGFCVLDAQAALLNLQQKPLAAAGGGYPANVFFSLDDSGSMDWEFVMGSYWEQCAYDPMVSGSFTSTDCGTFLTNNDGLPIVYLTTTPSTLGFIFSSSEDSNTGKSTTAQSSFTNAKKEWRMFSSDGNKIYYNPNVTYSPWKGECDFTNSVLCADASFSSVRMNPVVGTNRYATLKNLAGFLYEVWIDNKGFSGSRPMRGTNFNNQNSPNGIVDLWDSHIRVQLNASDATVYSYNYIPWYTTKGAGGLGEIAILQATLTGPACYNVLGTAELVRKIQSGALGYTSTGASGCRTITQAQQNFANWAQYYRKRVYVAKGVMADVIAKNYNIRIGLNTINDTIFMPIDTYDPTALSANNQKVIASFFELPAVGSTPLLSALDRAGQYFSNILTTTITTVVYELDSKGHLRSRKVRTLTAVPSPIIDACQQNFTVLLTDGAWGDSSSVGNVDGDPYSSTLSDVARKYYINDLSSTYANILPATTKDPATWQHMVTYGVSFGLTGNLVDTDGDGWPNPPLTFNSNWGGNPGTNNAAKIDDLWHAAFNSYGKYGNANDKSSVDLLLNSIMQDVVTRIGSASSVSQNSSVLSTTSQIFQATFDSTGWVGDVLAYSISPAGQISTTPTFSANCLLTGGICKSPEGTNTAKDPNTRVIITRNWTGANTGIAFRWPSNYSSYKVSGSLPTNMANFLVHAPYAANTTTSAEITANQAYGATLVNFLRGVRTNEAAQGGTFRNRLSVLGDIVDSTPIYVGPPRRVYPDSLETAAYSTFKSTYKTRTPMLYVGANDGMLHGFDATTGQEKLGYIPGQRQIYTRIPELSVGTYPHYFFVNATPGEGDVFYNSAWHTMLVTAMGNGSQSIAMLDITNPASFSESNAANMYISEFSDVNDPDIGYIPGTPIIAKVKTGTTTSKWAIIFNNGYNNTEADGYASTTGRPTLFIVFIEEAINKGWIADTTYVKIPVGTGSVTTPNGLGAPYVVDINQDYVVDYVYAGDQEGNLWKFDLTSASSAAWKTAATKLFSASFATAGDQPITAPPIVRAHPLGLSYGLMVYFGTGKLLEPMDLTSSAQVTQTFYAIWDKQDGAIVSKSKLLKQEILGTVTEGSNTYRIVSDNAITWTSGTSQNLGWYMDLVVGTSSNAGERVLSAPLLRNGNVIFTTFLPSSGGGCGGSTSGWLMELNSATGGTPIVTPFDTNNDGTFNELDKLKLTTGSAVVSAYAGGIQSTIGAVPTPTIFTSATDQNKEVKVLTGAGSLGTVNENAGSVNTGRQSWRQFF